MKANPDKCHWLTSTTAFKANKIKDNEILNSEGEKLLDVTIDEKLNFKHHLLKLIKKFVF